ncbi:MULTISPECIES: Na+/H+ antiporter subunit G [unclassified Corynebacterium]|uniref:Na+/H+ antiporter subunit G n=1 Tax=unclassified Corynebacterium TaxID=2624378 RepID=UPI0021094D13|nr:MULTISPECIES: Na+/H+ antiporter subunit G [unclassified Corynebacterium]
MTALTIWQIIVLLFVFVAVFMTVATVVLQLRAPNALTRANLMGPLVGVAFPALIIAMLIHEWSTEGFDLNNFLRAIIAILGVWIVASVGSFIIGRSIYGVTVTDAIGPGGRREPSRDHADSELRETPTEQAPEPEPEPQAPPERW